MRQEQTCQRREGKTHANALIGWLGIALLCTASQGRAQTAAVEQVIAIVDVNVVPMDSERVYACRK